MIRHILLSLMLALLSKNSFVKSFMMTKGLSTLGVSSTMRAMCTTAPVEELTELSRLEIRVGKVLEVSIHPEGENLFVEKVDMGEPEPRTIVSGLVGYQTAEQLLNRYVVVLANLKPRAIKGITSHGMLLCATSADKSQVDPLTPAEGAKPGELIRFAGHKSEPVEAGNRATKAYGKVAEGFFTNTDGIATYQGIPFLTPEGPCKSIHVGPIS
jgi:methionine--tRNA ligase beta chain